LQSVVASGTCSLPLKSGFINFVCKAHLSHLFSPPAACYYTPLARLLQPLLRIIQRLL
jgi:hypothetical protein